MFAGSVSGSYRTQYLLKYFKHNIRYAIYYVDDNFFSNNNTSFINKKIGTGLRLASQFFHLLFVDYVVIPAMSFTTPNIYKKAIWLKKKIIVDFYISMFDTYVLDRKVIQPGTKEALKWKKGFGWPKTFTYWQAPLSAKKHYRCVKRCKRQHRHSA